MVGPLRLGVVPYLNVAPILHGLRSDPGFSILPDLPSALQARLERGEIDLGMLPSIDYARGNYAIVPGIAIGSWGPVGSVVLFHRGGIDSVRRVALDTSSRTSVALVKILLRERLGGDPEYREAPPSVDAMLEEADAALVIGDPALDYEGEAHRFDLGKEWVELTGLPFVFAFWAGRPGAVTVDQVRALQSSLRAGLGALEEIASSYNNTQDRSVASRNEEYLRSRIEFGLGEDELSGLREFFRRAHSLGLIPEIPELRFHADR